MHLDPELELQVEVSDLVSGAKVVRVVPFEKCDRAGRASDVPYGVLLWERGRSGPIGAATARSA